MASVGASKLSNNIFRYTLIKPQHDVECNLQNSSTSAIFSKLETPAVQEKRISSAKKSVLDVIIKKTLEFYSRGFARTTSTAPKNKVGKAIPSTDICPIKKTKFKKEKKKLWNKFSSKEIAERQKTAEECKQKCEEYNKFQRGPDPDLDHLGGRVFKTCGTAYVIQKDMLRKNRIPETLRWENTLVDKLETLPELKNFKDPLPEFQTVGQRLLDLADKRLHPLYKKYMSTPKRPSKITHPTIAHKLKSGLVKPEETFVKCRFNKQFLDKKNIYIDFKRIEPTRPLLGKCLGNQIDDKPKMEAENSTSKSVNLE